MRPGEPAEVLVHKEKQYRDYSRRTDFGWIWVRDGRVWRESEEPSEEALFDEKGEWLAPSLREARARTDATILDGRMSSGEVREWAERAAELRPRNVCVFPAYIHAVRPHFKRPATVVSFPHGANTVEGKVAEIEMAERAGAGEVDVVAPVRLLQSGDLRSFRDEVVRIQEASRVPVKLILESSLLELETIAAATEIAAEAGIFCVKTSTGVLGQASPEAVRAMRSASPDIEIKASGGVRTRLDAGEMMRAGATIFGASNIKDWA